MHSVTKYLGGHSDVVMGALMVSDDALAERYILSKTLVVQCQGQWIAS